VIEVAALIHKDLAEQFRFARLVRSGEPDRQVGGEFNLKDGYRIGIHA
jgi:ribosome-interacting GTPase 1